MEKETLGGLAFPQAPGETMKVSGTDAIIATEFVTHRSETERDSVVLCVLPGNQATPFVVWRRWVTLVGGELRDRCEWGDYCPELGEAVQTYAARIGGNKV